ncbi:hypothetical protein V5O48_011522, partial [Marasmius crinis-equi]
MSLPGRIATSSSRSFTASVARNALEPHSHHAAASSRPRLSFSTSSSNGAFPSNPDSSPSGSLVVDPNVQLMPDDKVISTRKRHMDFDARAIANDSRQARQFLRWKEWHLKNESMVKTKMVKVGDILAGTSKGGIESGLASSGGLADHRIFKVQLIEPLEVPYALGFRCKLLSVGDTVVPAVPSASSRLCVKLYDDRFFPTPSFKDSRWYTPGDRYRSSEDYIRSELTAYQQGAEAVAGYKCHGAFK